MRRTLVGTLVAAALFGTRLFLLGVALAIRRVAGPPPAPARPGNGDARPAPI